LRGWLPERRWTSLLKKLQDQGYFDLNSDYASNSAVEEERRTVLTVYDDEQNPRGQGGSGAQPPGWDAIVKTVQGAGSTSSKS